MNVFRVPDLTADMATPLADDDQQAMAHYVPIRGSAQQAWHWTQVKPYNISQPAERENNEPRTHG